MRPVQKLLNENPLLFDFGRETRMTKKHHPIFEQFTPFSGLKPAGFSIGWTGVLVEDALFDWPHSEAGSVCISGQPEGGSDGYFDLIALYRAVDRAQGSFTMFELGAGYGYWLSEGWAAARKRNLAAKLVGVEGEPTHYEMMLRHLRNNGIDPSEHILLHAAVASKDGDVKFYVGDPQANWGQRIAFESDPETVGNLTASTLSGISLTSLLSQHHYVDLIHMDIQGAEVDVVASAVEAWRNKVGSFVIGTHSKEIERDLRRLFAENKWRCLYDYTIGEVNETDFGPVTFGDGVQIWENPNFDRSIEPWPMLEETPNNGAVSPILIGSLQGTRSCSASFKLIWRICRRWRPQPRRNW
jgi:FkbM family methyltransferase